MQGPAISGVALPNHHECLNFKPPEVPGGFVSLRMPSKKAGFFVLGSWQSDADRLRDALP
jgi:hypothetical protein